MGGRGPHGGGGVLMGGRGPHAQISAQTHSIRPLDNQ